MLTVKQGQLLQQLEAFDSECELMREQLEASQDRSINANNELSEVSQQKARLNNENNKLQVSSSSLLCLLAIIQVFKSLATGVRALMACSWLVLIKIFWKP